MLYATEFGWCETKFSDVVWQPLPPLADTHHLISHEHLELKIFRSVRRVFRADWHACSCCFFAGHHFNSTNTHAVVYHLCSDGVQCLQIQTSSFDRPCGVAFEIIQNDETSNPKNALSRWYQWILRRIFDFETNKNFGQSPRKNFGSTCEHEAVVVSAATLLARSGTDAETSWTDNHLARNWKPGAGWLS